MADHFEAVHSKLVYTAEKLPTNPPTHQPTNKEVQIQNVCQGKLYVSCCLGTCLFKSFGVKAIFAPKLEKNLVLYHFLHVVK